jgi:hypothetical protein
MPFRLPGRLLSRAPGAPIVARLEPTAAHESEVQHSADVAAPARGHDEHGPVLGLARGMGNRHFGGLIARMRDGEGILPGGRVDRRVEEAIAAARGFGRPLDRSVSRMLETGLGTSVGDVRVHTGDAAASLARAVSARAFTVGSDIFFGSGEYRPGSHDGNALIAHEVAHTVQQRGAPPTGPLTVSDPGDAMEREAEAVARGLSA